MTPVCAHARQLFISLDHEKSAYGTCSPGPCTASVEAAASTRRWRVHNAYLSLLCQRVAGFARPFIFGPVICDRLSPPYIIKLRTREAEKLPT